jgi:hypothetical protein
LLLEQADNSKPSSSNRASNRDLFKMLFLFIGKTLGCYNGQV